MVIHIAKITVIELLLDLDLPFVMFLAAILDMVVIINLETLHRLKRMNHLVSSIVVFDSPSVCGVQANHIESIFAKGDKVFGL